MNDFTQGDDGRFAVVCTAMRTLQDAIDAFLGTSARDETAATTLAPPPATIVSESSESSEPSEPTEPTDTPEATVDDDAGWERAVRVRADDDPQRSWVEANAAMRRNDHAQAFTLFEAEADRAAMVDDHARAAIAYRMASDAAAALGRRDDSDYDLRRAGKHYLFTAENPTSSLQTMYGSYMAASRCFLAVGNLELTQSCVTRALALQQAMNEDLHTRFNGPAQQVG